MHGATVKIMERKCPILSRKEVQTVKWSNVTPDPRSVEIADFCSEVSYPSQLFIIRHLLLHLTETSQFHSMYFVFFNTFVLSFLPVPVSPTRYSLLHLTIPYQECVPLKFRFAFCGSSCAPVFLILCITGPYSPGKFSNMFQCTLDVSLTENRR